MTTEQERASAQEADGGKPAQQQEHPQGHDAHAGQGSESAMKQMRVWEQRRTRLSGGRQRQGPA